MASLSNQIDFRRLVQKSLRREWTIIFANTTFILVICNQCLHDGPVLTTFESYCGMGKSWQKVGTMADSNGSLKYPQLLALMKCVLSFSRENAVPERDFYE